MSVTSRHGLRQTFLGRIHSGEWALGALIPSEARLADEYDCARTTVNRALQSLADEGLLIRKRKGGTRVCQTPVRKAKIDIPIIREQVTETGAKYSHRLVSRELTEPNSSVRQQLGLSPKQKAVHIKTLYLANERPYAFEDRWVNPAMVPKIMDAPLSEISVNEWLVKTVPFSNGDVVFSAANANPEISTQLKAKVAAALFVVQRRTWMDNGFITSVKVFYHEGYNLKSAL